MVRRTITITTCDVCAHDQQPERDATVSVVIKIDKAIPRRIDLCDDHAEVVERLKIVARTRGEKP